MEKILSWLESFKSFFSSEVAKISAAQAELVTVKAELATVKANSETTCAEYNEQVKALEKAQGEVNTLGAQVKALTDELATEKSKTTEALAQQGITADKLPEVSIENNSMNIDQKIKAIRDKLNSSTDPKEKYILSQEIKSLLAKSKN